MALALAMILLLGGCTRKEPTGEAIEPAPAPAPAKTLYQQGEDLAAQLVEMAGNRDYLSLYTGPRRWRGRITPRPRRYTA